MLIHKSSHLSEAHKISVNKKHFNPDLHGVLSRITNFDGLYLTGSYNTALTKTNVAAKDGYEWLKLHQPFTPFLAKYPEKHLFIINVLNTGSLNEHAIDIASTGTSLSSDIICLIETQLVPNQNTVSIENVLINFSVTFNSRERKFRSLTFCHAQSVEILNSISMEGISIFTVRKRTFTEDSITIALHYNIKKVPSHLPFIWMNSL